MGFANEGHVALRLNSLRHKAAMKLCPQLCRDLWLLQSQHALPKIRAILRADVSIGAFVFSAEDVRWRCRGAGAIRVFPTKVHA